MENFFRRTGHRFVIGMTFHPFRIVIPPSVLCVQYAQCGEAFIGRGKNRDRNDPERKMMRECMCGILSLSSADTDTTASTPFSLSGSALCRIFCSETITLPRSEKSNFISFRSRSSRSATGTQRAYLGLSDVFFPVRAA